MPEFTIEATLTSCWGLLYTAIQQKPYLIQTRGNRDLFLGVCKEHCLVAATMLFDRHPGKLVTYMEKCLENSKDSEGQGGPPYDHTRYAQLDYCLINQAQMGTIDVQSWLDLFATDHFILEFTMQMPMNFNEKKGIQGQTIL